MYSRFNDQGSGNNDGNNNSSGQSSIVPFILLFGVGAIVLAKLTG